MIDGHWTADVAQHDSKLFEVTNYIYDIGNAGAGSMSLVNKNALKDLEPQVRETFLRLTGEQHRRRLFDASRAAAERGRKQLVQDGMKPVPVVGQDRAKILTQVDPIISAWSAKLDPSSKRVYEKARNMIEAYNRGRN
jgi:TRAP-type C4-dicarboxylate transport system substrate-binding protein